MFSSKMAIARTRPSKSSAKVPRHTLPSPSQRAWQTAWFPECPRVCEPDFFEKTKDITDEELIQFGTPLKSRFGQEVISKANQILHAYEFPRQNLPRPKFWSDEERILTYELVVNIMKYEPFIEDAVYGSNIVKRKNNNGIIDISELENGENEIHTIVYDLMERGFGLNPEDKPMTGRYKFVQDVVLQHRTKIMANIARLRILCGANSIDHLLPANLRHQSQIDKNPLYGWVNLKKATAFEVNTFLELGGYAKAKCEDDILIQPDLFCIDANHSNLYHFHSEAYDRIQHTYLIREGKLIIQDKSACIYIYALVKALYYRVSFTGNNMLRRLMSVSKLPDEEGIIREPWFEGLWDNSDKNIGRQECVVVTHCGSGRSAAHLAMLLSEAAPRYISKESDMVHAANMTAAMKGKFVIKPALTVIVFGVPYHKMEEISHEFRKFFCISNIRLYPEEFTSVAAGDLRIRGAIAILVNPPSSGSAIKDLVSYICTEGGDESVLAQMRKFVAADGDEDKLKRFTKAQMECFKLALSMVDVKLVLYTTCSNFAYENVHLVKSCLAKVRGEEDKRRSAVIEDILNNRIKNYRATTFELVDLKQVMTGYDDNCFRGKYMEVPPSSLSSGVFLALVRRRDMVIPLHQDPIGTFVFSQVMATPKSKASLNNNPTTPGAASASVSSSTIAGEKKPESPKTVQQWREYFLKKYEVDIDQHLQPGGFQQYKNQISGFNNAAHANPRKGKGGIVDRLSAPTYASLSRQTDKWNSSTPSISSSGPNKTGSKVSTSSSSGRKPFGNMSSSGAPCAVHKSYNCVCARHAKKFPEFSLGPK